jgi:ABC-type lipoprotein export system ATPase subunit
VLITHEQDIAEYAGRVVAFRDGHIISDHPVAGPRDAQAELAALPAPDTE